MADPISIIGLVGQVADLIQRAYEYGKAVHDAHSDMQKLYTELLGLKGALEQLQKLEQPEDLPSTEPHIQDLLGSAEFGNTLLSTQQLVGRLMGNLNRKQTSSRRVNALLWPWVKDDVKADILDLERVKTWFILMMMAGNSSQMKALMNESHEILLVVRESQASQKFKEEDEKRQKLKSWIQPFDPTQLHAKAAEKRMKSTGMWFLDGTFKDWKDGGEKTPKILWLRGKSGAGKTILHAAAVDELKSCHQKDPKIGFAFFYCSFDDRESQTPINILGSIAYQLSEQFPQALVGIEELHKAGALLSVGMLADLISQYISNFEKFYILVDAINESFNCRDIFGQLLQIVATGENVRLLVTAISSCSHLLADLELKDPPDVMEEDMNSAGVERDIDFYITTRMSEERRLRQLSPETKLEMCQQILQNANRMFRYVQCQLDYLLTLRTTKMIKMELFSLPKDIYAVYEMILSNIPDSDKPLAQESLFLVAGALRPLTILELAEAVVVDREDTQIDEESRLPEPEVLLEICQGLLTFDKSTRIVTLAHSSVRSYLVCDRIHKSEVSYYGYNLSGVHDLIMNKCLIYILFDHFRVGCSTDEDLAKLHDSYPFLRYASRYWPLHMRLAVEAQFNKADSIKLCLSHKDPNGGNFALWVQCLMPDATKDLIRATEPLYYAASFGLTDLVKSLLTSENVNIDALGGRNKSSALHVACYRGHKEIARLLLECGADVNLTDEEGSTPLFWAEKMGRSEVVALLQEPKYAQRKGKTVLVLSKAPERSDYPFWFCCHCNTGPQRGRFHSCGMCSHERCNICVKMAGGEDAETIPKSQSRWMCCNCESGPTRVETTDCHDCEHEKCMRCWVFSISV